MPAGDSTDPFKAKPPVGRAGRLISGSNTPNASASNYSLPLQSQNSTSQYRGRAAALLAERGKSGSMTFSLKNGEDTSKATGVGESGGAENPRNAQQTTVGVDGGFKGPGLIVTASSALGMSVTPQNVMPNFNGTTPSTNLVISAANSTEIPNCPSTGTDSYVPSIPSSSSTSRAHEHPCPLTLPNQQPLKDDSIHAAPGETPSTEIPGSATLTVLAENRHSDLKEIAPPFTHRLRSFWHFIRAYLQLKAVTIPPDALRIWNILIDLLVTYEVCIAPILVGWIESFLPTIVRWFAIFFAIDLILLADAFFRSILVIHDEWGVKVDEVKKISKAICLDGVGCKLEVGMPILIVSPLGPLTSLGNFFCQHTKLRDVTTPTESIYVLFEFIIGMLVYATIFGNIDVVLRQMDSAANKQQQELEHKIDTESMKNFMRTKGLTPDLQKKILSYKEIQWRRIQGFDETRLFEDLPRTLQQSIQDALYLDLVKKVPLFQDMEPAMLSLLTFCITPLIIPHGWYLFQKGDEGNEMFFVKRGTIEILIPGKIIEFNVGSYFGEIALIDPDCKRTAPARARGDVELCVLSKEDLQVIMGAYPRLRERIEAELERRRQEQAAAKAKAEAEAAAKLKAEMEALERAAQERRARDAVANKRASRTSFSLMSHRSRLLMEQRGGNGD
ncbi:Cyclic nucleotide-gated cation channel alpha-3 [Quaeritorhiza haematococci]|nr:Cyclic nucleotide-gated cation channel alpha-3 [Quaeritorhiza haematococci]